jgi:hypothetical protein
MKRVNIYLGETWLNTLKFAVSVTEEQVKNWAINYYGETGFDRIEITLEAA